MKINSRKLQKTAGILMVLSIFSALFCGCSRGSGVGEEEQNTFRIVTSFYPMYTMVSGITEGVSGVEVVNMASPQTGCLHDYQLRPKDLVCLEDADLFVINGGGMEEFLSDVFESREDLKVVSAMDALEEAELLPGGEEDEGGNPHTWMNPALYQKEVEYLTDILVKEDPDHAGAYEANAQDSINKIQTLSKEIDRLRTCDPGKEKTGCILLHESFAYLMDAMDIPVVKVMDVEKDSGFSAGELKELVDETKEISRGIIVSDKQYSGKIAELLAEETGFEVVHLDACVSGELKKDAYIDSMEYNLEEWKKCSGEQ